MDQKKEWQRVKDRPEADPEEAEAKERLYEDLKENGPKNLYKLTKKRIRRSHYIVRGRSYI